MTLIETLTVLSLFSLLCVVTVACYRYGAAALKKGQDHSALRSELTTAVRRIGDSLRSTSLASVTISPAGDAVSLLSTLDSGGQTSAAADGAPEWRRYLIFYHDAGQRTLALRELELGPGSAQRRHAGPVEQYSHNGNPPEELEGYLTAGRPLARNIRGLKVSVTPDNAELLTVELESEEPQKGIHTASRRAIALTVHCRN